MSEPRPGLVYLVGAGPGDPGLLTRRGAEALSRADVVVYDHLASSRLLDLAPAGAIRICAGKSIGHCTLSQPEINQTLADHALVGRTVVRLKGGDPFVFGRGGEEAEFLATRGVPFQVVPGVTAGLGVTAYAGMPVTHRGLASAVAFVTGHNDPDATEKTTRDWDALARFPGTLVVYMGVTRLERICEALTRRGKPAATTAALVESGTLPRQRTVVGTLADLPARVAEAGLGPPALLVIGEVVERRRLLRWFEARPLFGRRIVVTRPEGELDQAAASLEQLGAEALLAPTVAIGPAPDLAPVDDAIARLPEFDWLVFTSGNGVRAWFDRVEELGHDLRKVGHLKLAAIGPGTAQALRAYHLRADLVPAAYRSEALAEALVREASGQRVLLARADRGRTILKDELSRVAHVEQVAVYTNRDADSIPEAVASSIATGTVDWITLTSSAIARRLHDLLPDEARAQVGKTVRLASISPVTSAAARDLGWLVAVEASEFTWDGLVQSLAEQVGREAPTRLDR